jgi:hypothetical protein
MQQALHVAGGNQLHDDEHNEAGIGSALQPQARFLAGVWPRSGNREDNPQIQQQRRNA